MNIVFGLLLLCALVFVHELGHFFAARLCRVKVESFSIGMGPILLHKEIFGTDWRISAIPLGGYCAMKGEQDADAEFTKIDADSFYGRGAIFRAIIGAAGPFANAIFAALMLSVLALFPHPYYSATAEIDFPTEIESNAKKAGLFAGDKIVSIENEDVLDFSDISKIVQNYAGKTVKIQVERNGEKLFFDVAVSDDGKIGVTNLKKMTTPLPVHRAIAKGTFDAGKMIFLYVDGIISLFRTETKLTESINGPARITSELGAMTKYGFAPVLTFLSYISVALCVMNLLPLPVLDGWLILVSLVEAIFRVKIRGKARIIAQYAGIALLVALFLIATANDILFFLGGKQ